MSNELDRIRVALARIGTNTETLKTSMLNLRKVIVAQQNCFESMQATLESMHKRLVLLEAVDAEVNEIERQFKGGV